MRREEPTSHGVSTANADAAKVGCFCGRPRASEQRSRPSRRSVRVLSSSCRYSFVGAHAKHIGYFESANRGTLFLDELRELPLGTQTRLLRVLQERVVQRVGGTEVLPVDVRIVAATNRDVDAATAAGTLRKDLLYRLDVVRLTVPPLRSRPDDILPLADRFARGVSRRALIYKMERYGLKEPPKARGSAGDE